MASVEPVLRGMSLTSDQGNFALCGVYLIRAGDRSILYDFGHVGRRQKLMAALSRRRLRPHEIDTVVVSHAHWDHLQNLDMFSEATVIVHDEELAYLANPHPDDHATPAWSKSILAGATAHATVEGEQLAPGVTVVHLPGHTPGSIGLRVETDEGVAVVTGDALATAQDAVRRWCPNVFWDPDLADASVRRMVEVADVYYPGHDRPFRLTADGAVEYLVELRTLTLTAAEPSPPIQVVPSDRTQRRLSGRAAEVGARIG